MMVDMDISQETDVNEEKCKNCLAPAEIEKLCRPCHDLFKQHSSGSGVFAEEAERIKKRQQSKRIIPL